jgi:uncharacterized membrane protein
VRNFRVYGDTRAIVARRKAVREIGENISRLRFADGEVDEEKVSRRCPIRVRVC